MLACEQTTGGNSRATALWTLDGAGELGFVVEVLTPEVDGGFGGFHHIAVVRTGPLVIQIWLNHNVPDAPALTPTLDLLEVAVERACQAAGTPCGAGSITADPTALDPSVEPSEDDEIVNEPFNDPLLLLADLPTWDGALPWDTVQDVEEEAYGVDCHPLWADLGALSHTKRVFTVSTADPRDAVSATEVLATFPDEATAEEAVAAMRDGMATCKSRSVVADGVTVEMINPLEYGDSAWLMTIPGGGSTPPGRIMVGFVRSGSTAALVTVNYSLDAELTGGPFLLTLDLADAKLGGQ
jgi:hypothetical protein